MDKRNKFRFYIPDECIVFSKTKEAFGGLSNMAAGYPIIINGVRVPSSEALYQACRFPHLPELQKQIISQYSPMVAKRLSQAHKDDSREDWAAIRVRVMRWCLRVKLHNNFYLFGTLLAETGDKNIVELSNKDEFWGARLNAHGQLEGQNVLGRLLMELREEIKLLEANEINVEVPPITNFFFLKKEFLIHKLHHTTINCVSNEH